MSIALRWPCIHCGTVVGSEYGSVVLQPIRWTDAVLVVRSTLGEIVLLAVVRWWCSRAKGGGGGGGMG